MAIYKQLTPGGQKLYRYLIVTKVAIAAALYLPSKLPVELIPRLSRGSSAVSQIEVTDLVNFLCWPGGWRQITHFICVFPPPYSSQSQSDTLQLPLSTPLRSSRPYSSATTLTSDGGVSAIDCSVFGPVTSPPIPALLLPLGSAPWPGQGQFQGSVLYSDHGE